MTTDIATRGGSDLAVTQEQSFWTDKQIAALHQLGVDNASNGDLAVFFHQCTRTGLDPFAKQIYMIGRWSKDGTKYTIQTGIDGYRLIARRAVDRTRETLGYTDTVWCGPDGQWRDVWLERTPPAAAKVTVLRNGTQFPAIALYSEYVQTYRDKKSGDQVPTQMWADRAAGQLAKCAEALALRKAFPQDLSGIYTTDEMAQATDDRGPAQVQQRPQAPTLDQAVQQHQQQAASPASATEQGEPYRTEQQSRKIFATAKDAGISNDELKPFMATVIGREVESSKTLTKAEAGKIIEALEDALPTSSDVPANVDPKTGEVTDDVVDAELVDEAQAWTEQDIKEATGESLWPGDK